MFLLMQKPTFEYVLTSKGRDNSDKRPAEHIRWIMNPKIHSRICDNSRPKKDRYRYHTIWIKNTYGRRDRKYIRRMSRGKRTAPTIGKLLDEGINIEGARSTDNIFQTI